MSDAFLARAKSNQFCALKQCGNDPNEYAQRMRILGRYHTQDVHQRVDANGKPQKCPCVCSCRECDEGRQQHAVWMRQEVQGQAEEVG